MSIVRTLWSACICCLRFIITRKILTILNYVSCIYQHIKLLSSKHLNCGFLLSFQTEVDVSFKLWKLFDTFNGFNHSELVVCGNVVCLHLSLFVYINVGIHSTFLRLYIIVSLYIIIRLYIIKPCRFWYKMVKNFQLALDGMLWLGTWRDTQRCVTQQGVCGCLWERMNTWKCLAPLCFLITLFSCLRSTRWSRKYDVVNTVSPCNYS